MMFLHIAEGIDDRTWEHHLKAGDYSEWFRDKVKDDELADEAAAIEADRSLDAAESRSPHRRGRASPLHGAGRLKPPTENTFRKVDGYTGKHPGGFCAGPVLTQPEQ